MQNRRNAPLDASAGTTVVLILALDGLAGCESWVRPMINRGGYLMGSGFSHCLAFLISLLPHLARKENCVDDGDPRASPVNGFLVPNI